VRQLRSRCRNTSCRPAWAGLAPTCCRCRPRRCRPLLLLPPPPRRRVGRAERRPRRRRWRIPADIRWMADIRRPRMRLAAERRNLLPPSGYPRPRFPHTARTAASSAAAARPASARRAAPASAAVSWGVAGQGAREGWGGLGSRAEPWGDRRGIRCTAPR
jgi:hypothetical protein